MKNIRRIKMNNLKRAESLYSNTGNNMSYSKRLKLKKLIFKRGNKRLKLLKGRKGNI